MGKASLGAFRSTPLGTVTAESGLTPARALLSHRQASFARRLHARPRDGDGPGEILERDRSTLATRLRAAAALRRTETVRPQVWVPRRFPGQIVIEDREGAIIAASQHGQVDTFWTDGSRLDNKRARAAVVWRLPSGWVGRRYHLGNNKDAEVFAIYQALRIINRRPESGRRYTLFIDFTAAMERVRTDALGPGQAHAIAAMSLCDLINECDNQVTIHWVPAHNKVEGNEVADRFAKAAAGRTAPCNDGDIPDDFLDEASLSYMTRTATEARSQATVEWISSRVGAPRYRLPPGRDLRRRHLRSVRKELAGRFYQFLSGRAAVGSYLHDKIHKIDSDRYWWRNTGERQSRFHPTARRPAWAGQARAMWRRIAQMCEWKTPRAPAVRLIDDVRATPAVLSFLRDTRVGRMVPLDLGMSGEGKTRVGRLLGRERKTDQARHRMYFSFVFFVLVRFSRVRFSFVFH